MKTVGVHPRYVFLMRHAEQRGGHLTESGTEHLRALAGRFSEWMLAAWRGDPTRTVHLWCTTPASEVQETAEVLASAVLEEMYRHKEPVGYPFRGPKATDGQGETASVDDKRDVSIAGVLPSTATKGSTTPADDEESVQRALSAYSPDEAKFDALCRWLTATEVEQQNARRSDVDSPLLVGNDPLIGWLAGRLTGHATAIGRGEMVCLVDERPPSGRWRLLWTVSEDGEAESDAVRAKIKSKMTTAAALGTVIVGLTTFLLQNPLQKEPTIWHWLAFGAMSSSAALYFAALFLYDSLQMPPRFWASRFPSSSPRRLRPRSGIWARLQHGRPSLQRPPTSTARLLQINMMRIWSWIFTPATLLAGVGIVLLALGATAEGRDDILDVQFWHVVVATAGLAALLAVWVAWKRPDLGATD
jgi:hypothetical protein